MNKCIRVVLSLILTFSMLLPMALPVAIPVSAETSYGFVDFPTGWSAPAMSHAVANGLIRGKSNDRIAPEDNLTRAEMGTIINRAFGAAIGKDISAFSDVSPSEWYYEDIKKSYNMQTMYGDAGGTMRPDAFIIREEAIAIVARAMVLSGYSASNLDRFGDKAEISDWAVDPLASMAANGYVNGDEKSNMNPKAFITREEFAQLLYNIIKHYYNPENKQETYQGNLMLNKPDISLEKIKVDGDLVLGDGVGTSVITLTDIKIEGRLLVRGAAQITLKNVTTGKGVVVKNVNGTVHFDNYRDEKVFDGVVEHTNVTYKQRLTGGTGSTTLTTAAYKVEHYQEELDGSFTVFETENLSGTIGTTVTAIAKTYEGFTEDTLNALRVPSGTVTADGALTLKLYYTRNSYDVTYNYGEAGGSNTVSLKYGADVSLELPSVAAPANKYFAGWYDDGTGGTQYTSLKVPIGGITIYAHWSLNPGYVIQYYKQNPNDDGYTLASTETKNDVNEGGTATIPVALYDHFYEITHAETLLSGIVTITPQLVLKRFYNRTPYTVTLDYDGADVKNGNDSYELRYEQTINLPVPEKAGYQFGGWFSGANGTGVQFINGETFEETTVTQIYANWIPVPVSYTVLHHYEKLEGGYEVVTDSTNIALTGSTVENKYKTGITGFTVDLGIVGTVNSSVVAGDGSTELKYYYTRKTYTIDYNTQGGEIDATTPYDTEFKYKETVTLAHATNENGKELEGWYTRPNGKGVKVIDTAAISDSILEGLYYNEITLYAHWEYVDGYYSIEYYQENLDGSYSLKDTDEDISGKVGTIVKVEDSNPDYDDKYIGFSVNTNHTDNVLSAKLEKTGTVLKVYYKRNEYTLKYNYSDATVSGIESKTFKYGETIQFPAEDTYEKDGFKAAGWYKSTAFADEDLLDASLKIEDLVDVENGETEATIYVKWSDVFTVTFREGGIIDTYLVDPAVSEFVPYSEFPYDKLTARYINGYYENAEVSSVYSGNEYQHQMEGDWYYFDRNGKEVVFTDKVVVDRDITVRYKFRYARLELFVEKLGHNVVLEVPFEESTRFIDSLKDGVFLNQEYILLGYNQLDLKEKLIKLNLKVVDILADKGFEMTPGQLIADDGEILKQHIKFNAFAYMDEATLKTTVVNAIKTTLKNDPLRLRGVIDEMMKEKDPDVIQIMDDMLVSMLSGSDSQRIKDIIADALEEAIEYNENDTDAERAEKDELRQQIKDIIIVRLDEEAKLGDGVEKPVTDSVKDAVYDYFMNKENDTNIRTTVIDLIDDAYEMDENNEPANPEVRDFVKGYITDYFKSEAGSVVFDNLILELGETLSIDNPDDKPIIDLIHDVLAKDDRNEEGLTYLEELVDGVIEDLHILAEEDEEEGSIYDFVVDAITTELEEDEDELETLIRAIGDSEPADLKSVLEVAMKNDGAFKVIVETAVQDDNVFADVINTAVSNTEVFETVVRELCATETGFYTILADIALGNTALKAEVMNAVTDNDDALIRVIKEVASNNELKAEIIEELLEAGETELIAKLKNPLDIYSEYYTDVKNAALKQAETEIIGIITTGINENDHPDYWPIAFEKAMDVAKANITQDLIDLGVDPNGSLWDGLFANAVAQAEIDVTAELNGGITAETSIYYQVAVDGAKAQAETEITNLLSTGIAEGSKYWQVAYDTAKDIARDKIIDNFDSEIEKIKSDDNIKIKVREWAAGSIDKPEIEEAISGLIESIAASEDEDDVQLRGEIIETVIATVKTQGFDTAGLASNIITELDKEENSTIKNQVVQKAIEVLNKDDYEVIKTSLIAEVLNEVLPEEGEADEDKADIVEKLIEQLIEQVNEDDGGEGGLKSTVISVAIDAVVYDDHVNAEAITIINKLIDESPESNADGTPTFKEKCITHIVTYILQTPTVRAEAMAKVVAMIETPYNPEVPGSVDYKSEAIEFAFNVLGSDSKEAKRHEIAKKLLDSILNAEPVNGVYTERENLANNVKDIMFNSNGAIRNRILDFGFEQMFAGDIEGLVLLALDKLIGDADVRREMILAIIETESGRESILDILFEELERDSTFLDKIIDLAMKGKYGDMVDKFVYDLVNRGQIQINPDNRQIAEEIVLPMLDDITLDTVMAKLPVKITEILPESKIEQIFNKFKQKARQLIVEGIEEAKQGNSKDIQVMIDNDFDVVNSILIPLYNKAFPKAVDKAEDFYYYNENQYIKAIVDMIDPEFLLDHTKPASAMGTGYRIKDSKFYYELVRNILVLADDAATWYMDNISDEQIDKVITKLENAYNKVLTKVNDLIGNRIPKDKLDKIVDFAKKIVDKRERIYNVTTTAGFEYADKAYNKLLDFVKEKTGKDISESTTIEVTFDGSNITLNDDKSVNIDNYKIDISAGGATVYIDSHTVSFNGKTVDISGYVQKIANKFGTRKVTVKVANDAPYEFGMYVGNNYVKLSAFYK